MTLRAFALEFGLHDEQVLTEEFSRNTYENAVKATEIIRAAPYRDLVLLPQPCICAVPPPHFINRDFFPIFILSTSRVVEGVLPGN